MTRIFRHSNIFGLSFGILVPQSFSILFLHIQPVNRGLQMGKVIRLVSPAHKEFQNILNFVLIPNR